MLVQQVIREKKLLQKNKYRLSQINSFYEAKFEKFNQFQSLYIGFNT
jgi:hypothetical protein